MDNSCQDLNSLGSNDSEILMVSSTNKLREVIPKWDGNS